MTGQKVIDNLDRVREQIESACAVAGRSSESVQLVAVSKKIPIPLVVEALRAGQMVLGENRVLDALERQEELSKTLADSGIDTEKVLWHFIGHLQGNKAARAIGRFELNHGIDSLKLAERISRLVTETGQPAERILLEVNISREPQKHGFLPEELPRLVCNISELPGIDLRGFMGMSKRGSCEKELRETYASLRGLADTAREISGLPLPELSMGMSGDFREAIAEGSTLVRIGSSIFGERQI